MRVKKLTTLGSGRIRRVSCGVKFDGVEERCANTAKFGVGLHTLPTARHGLIFRERCEDLISRACFMNNCRQKYLLFSIKF